MLKNLGERIRKLRKDRSITLVELAKRTGVAQATLSRIETGTMMGTIESHERIAEAMGLGLAELYSGVDRRYDEISHLPRETQRKVTRQTKEARFELLTQESSKKKITPLLVTISARSETAVESNERGVEKFIFVLEGELTVKIDQEDYPLKTEETLYFDASLPHKIVNRGAATARVLMAVSPSKL